LLDSSNLSSKSLASFAAQSKHPVRADMAQEKYSEWMRRN
jgi:hypothetical protein